MTWKSRHHQRGFLHRLDVPSSGLILVATSYTAYYDLRLQLSTGMISREYIALCHGLLRNRQVTAPVFWRKGFADASSVRPEGRPAISDLELMAKYLGFNRGFSLVRILIGTGRRHQIRVHTAHVGNPIVCDSKYAVWTTFEEDLTWCPRNFLHRHQLSFQEEVELFPERKGSHKTCSAWEPLPEDLRCALEVLNCSWRSQRAGNIQKRLPLLVCAVSCPADVILKALCWALSCFCSKTGTSSGDQTWHGSRQRAMRYGFHCLGRSWLPMPPSKCGCRLHGAVPQRHVLAPTWRW